MQRTHAGILFIKDFCTYYTYCIYFVYMYVCTYCTYFCTFYKNEDEFSKQKTLLQLRRQEHTP